MSNPQGRYYKKWLIMAPLGLVIVGMGICFVTEAAFLKFTDAPTWQWVAAGTGALSVFNAGLCVFGDAIIARTRYLEAKDRSQSR